MKKQIIRLITLTVILSLIIGLVATGCSKKTDNKPQADKTQTKEHVTISYTFWGSPNEKKVVEDSIKKFEEKYNWITVDLQHIPADYATKITTMVAANQAPDVAYMDPTVAFDWAVQDKFVNIYDLLQKDTELKKEDFVDNIFYEWAPGKSHGTISAIEPFGIFYNADLFKQTGVELPPTKAENAWTWDKFVEIAKKMTIDKNGKDASDPSFDFNNIKQYGVSFDPGWGPMSAMLISNEAEWVSKDGKKFALTDPAAIEVIQKMADLINKYHVAPSPAQAKSIPAPAVALQSKQVAMLIDGQWDLLDLAAAKMNFGVGVLPKFKRATTMLQGSVRVIFKSTKHLEESWLLYKWWSNPENVLPLEAGGLWMPLFKNWYTDPTLIAKWAEGNPAHPEGFKDAFMNQVMKNGIRGPSLDVKNMSKLKAIVIPALEQVWSGKKSAEEVMKEIEPKAQAEVKGRYDIGN